MSNTDKFDRFVDALEALCHAHGVALHADLDGTIVVDDLYGAPLNRNLIHSIAIGAPLTASDSAP